MEIILLVLFSAFCFYIAVSGRKKIFKKSKANNDPIEIITNKKSIYTNRKSESDKHIDKLEKQQQKDYDAWRIKMAMSNLIGFDENDYLFKVDELADELIKSQTEIILLKSSKKNYEVLLNSAIRQYNKNSEIKVSEYQKEFAINPNRLDIDTIVQEKYTKIVSSYKSYWENQISGLKRKSAIINRRKYLIEQIDGMIPLVKSKKREDLLDLLIDYKEYQQKVLSEL